MTTLFFIGGCISNAFKFSLNIIIAPSSASMLKSFLISLIIEGTISLFKESFIASNINSLHFSFSTIILENIIFIISLSPKDILTFKIPSFSPLLIANIL